MAGKTPKLEVNSAQLNYRCGEDGRAGRIEAVQAICIDHVKELLRLIILAERLKLSSSEPAPATLNC